MERYEEIEKSIITTYRKKIWSKFIKGIKEFEMVQEGDKIAVCISGGKDSMLLAKCMQELKKHRQVNFDLVFLVMDPGYNPINRQKIINNAKLLNIPITMFESNIFEVVEKIDDHPCYVCARMRRGALHDASIEAGCNKLALGHHYNDAVETFVMNLFNEGRIGCFSPKTYLSKKDIWLIRPMVLTSEKEIFSACRRNGLEVVKSKCPADGHTNREKTKNFLAEMEKESHGFTYRLFGAMRRANIDGWGGVNYKPDENKDN